MKWHLACPVYAAGMTPRTLVRKLHKRNRPVGSDVGANEALVTVGIDRCDSEDEIINRNIVKDEMSCIADDLIARNQRLAAIVGDLGGRRSERQRSCGGGVNACVLGKICGVHTTRNIVCT